MEKKTKLGEPFYVINIYFLDSITVWFHSKIYDGGQLISLKRKDPWSDLFLEYLTK